MKVLRLVLVLVIALGFSGLRAYADAIDIYVGAGTVGLTQSGGGESLSFSGMKLFTSDSSLMTPLTISGGSGGFHFTGVSNGVGNFAPLSGATFSMGNSTSGITAGSINSIQIIGATVGSSLTTFSIQLTFNNLSFTGCTAASCTNSSTLQQLASAPNGSAILEFSFQNSTASTLAQLLNLKGTNSSTMSGEFDADSSVTPEPASLALFGSGLVAFGLRISRRKKKA